LGVRVRGGPERENENGCDGAQQPATTVPEGTGCCLHAGSPNPTTDPEISIAQNRRKIQYIVYLFIPFFLFHPAPRL
jgi:hypothetical protein